MEDGCVSPVSFQGLSVFYHSECSLLSSSVKNPGEIRPFLVNLNRPRFDAGRNSDGYKSSHHACVCRIATLVGYLSLGIVSFIAIFICKISPQNLVKNKTESSGSSEMGADKRYVYIVLLFENAIMPQFFRSM